MNFSELILCKITDSKVYAAEIAILLFTPN